MDLKVTQVGDLRGANKGGVESKSTSVQQPLIAMRFVKEPEPEVDKRVETAPLSMSTVSVTDMQHACRPNGRVRGGYLSYFAKNSKIRKTTSDVLTSCFY